MKNFDIAKYLREHQLGSYGILNHYVDLKPLKEEETAVAFKSGDKVKVNPDFAGDLKQASINAGLQPEAGSALAEYPNDVFEVIESDEKTTTIKFEGDEIVVPTKILVKTSEIKEDAYEGHEHKLTGNGEGDEFKRAKTVSEEDSMGANRNKAGGKSKEMELAIFNLKNSGFDAEEVENLFRVIMSHHFGNEDEYDMEDEEDLF